MEDEATVSSSWSFTTCRSYAWHSAQLRAGATNRYKIIIKASVESHKQQNSQVLENRERGRVSSNSSSGARTGRKREISSRPGVGREGEAFLARQAECIEKEVGKAAGSVSRSSGVFKLARTGEARGGKEEGPGSRGSKNTLGMGAGKSAPYLGAGL